MPGQKVILELETDDKTFVEKHKNKIQEKTSTEIKYVSGLKLEKLVEKSFAFEIKK